MQLQKHLQWGGRAAIDVIPAVLCRVLVMPEKTALEKLTSYYPGATAKVIPLVQGSFSRHEWLSLRSTFVTNLFLVSCWVDHIWIEAPMSSSISIAEPLWPQLAVIAAVSASHMSMPNHWLPYSLVARAHSWTLRKALFLTFLGALGHVTNTILISLLISEIGGALISHDNYRLLSSSILLLGGCYYLYTYTVQCKRSSCCTEEEGDETTEKHTTISKSRHADGDPEAVHRTAEISVVMLTALSPCVGSMPVLVSIMAPPARLSTVLAAGATLLGTSAIIMCSLVALSYFGAATLNFARIRRHERLMMGLGLVVLAGLTFFVFAREHVHGMHDQNGEHWHGSDTQTHEIHVPGNGVSERVSSR